MHVHMQAQRITALQQCCTMLQTPAGAHAARQQMQQLWPQALRLLGDRAAQVRQTAAVLAGRLGALAATAPSASGGSGEDSCPQVPACCKCVSADRGTC